MAIRNNKKLVRSRYINVRVTQVEKDKLAKKAAGRTLSCYIRGLIVDGGSRAALRLEERVLYTQLAALSEALAGHIENVETASSLKRSDVAVLLASIVDDVDRVRIEVLAGLSS